ncbi:MAG: aminodeoxychorismate synthase component I [Alphaproteobacteria bacterium]
MSSIPTVFELFSNDIDALLRAVAQQKSCVILESAAQQDDNAYSFAMFDPFLEMLSRNGAVTLNFKDGKTEEIDGDPFEVLQELMKNFSLEREDDIKGLPPFQTGVAGYFGYELHQHLEDIPIPPENGLGLPDLALGFYDVVIAVNHHTGQSWIISSGFPEKQDHLRVKRAQQRAEEVQKTLAKTIDGFTKKAPQAFPKLMWHCPVEQKIYEKTIQKTVDYIHAGDIFQANISLYYEADWNNKTPYSTLYEELKEKNPAPFSSYIQFDDFAVISASPERFVSLEEEAVFTSPIKGTRARGKTQKEDRALAEELIHSEKDIAENVMIVDLLRNDLSKVCEPRSVQVTELCRVESFAKVHHLVSDIEGEIKDGYNAVDLLKAAFPGGSITGAPKPRAMEIVAEMESAPRGAYCGAAGYIGFNGDADTNILIRTLMARGGKLRVHAGGGIVADSSPAAEYQEVMTKLQGLLL